LLAEALAAAHATQLRWPFLRALPDCYDTMRAVVEYGSADAGFVVDLLERHDRLVRRGAPAVVSQAQALTERELTVLRYLTSALSNAEIATELFVSVNTIKTHERMIYRKLAVGDRRAAVRRGRELGLV
jgi:LuxR family maltose regulon positive regulatory protein